MVLMGQAKKLIHVGCYVLRAEGNGGVLAVHPIRLAESSGQIPKLTLKEEVGDIIALLSIFNFSAVQKDLMLLLLHSCH